MDAKLIREAVARYYTKKNYAVNFEVGLAKGGRLRADVLCVNLAAHIVLIEVKSSVADFKTDKKWHLYKSYGDKMHFAMDAETYEKVKSLIPKGVGVFVVHTLKSIVSKQSARNGEIDPETRLDLIIRMAYRSADRNKYNIKSKFDSSTIVK